MSSPSINVALRSARTANTATCAARPCATPWHVCVHGLGLETGAVSAPLTPLLHLSALLVERSHAEPFACVAHELLRLLSHHHEPLGGAEALPQSMQRIANLLAAIGPAETRAVAQAAVLHVLAHFNEPADGVIQESLDGTLADLLRTPRSEPRRHYQSLCASAQLLEAAQRAAGAQSVHEQIAARLDAVWQGAMELEHAFDAKRIKAVLCAVQARSARQRQSPAWLDQLARLLAECTAIHGPLPSDDEIHSGLDFITFPLALALDAATQSAPARRLAMTSAAARTALHLLEQLSPPSKVSQLAFLVGPLLALGAEPLAVLQQRASSTLQDYLDTSADDDADAYLRSTYAIYTAAQLGSAERLPREVFTRLEQALLVRGRPDSGYFSLPMVAAYVLYASGVTPAAQRALPDAEALVDVLASRLALEAVPAVEAHKLGHALLYLGLTRHAGHIERAYSNPACEVAV